MTCSWPDKGLLSLRRGQRECCARRLCQSWRVEEQHHLRTYQGAETRLQQKLGKDRDPNKGPKK